MRVSKRDAFNSLLSRGDVWIHVLIPKKGVDVPGILRGKSFCTFHVGMNMPVPITEMKSTPEHFEATLHFNGAGHYHVVFPWKAVFGIVDREGIGFVDQDLVPAELQPQVVRRAHLPDDIRRAHDRRDVEYEMESARRTAEDPLSLHSERFDARREIAAYERQLGMAELPKPGTVVSLADRRKK